MGDTPSKPDGTEPELLNFGTNSEQEINQLMLEFEMKLNITSLGEDREKEIREKAQRKFTYKKLVDGLKNDKFKKIVVCTGAGISVSAGIPDFRSEKTGLYANLEKYELPRPEAIFDIAYFKEKPEAFYKLANEFLDCSKFKPTPTHHFIKLLQDKGLLQFNLT